MPKQVAPQEVQQTTTMSIEGDASFHAHFVAIAALLKIGKGRLARKAINAGLPAVIGKLATDAMRPYIDQHLEAIGIKVKDGKGLE